MTTTRQIILVPVTIAALLLSSCAALEEIAVPPQVTLRSVAVKDLDFKRQTFVLAFDVTNPNPLTLPVKSVDYGLELDGQRFASGEVLSSFTIPGGGDTTFSISVDLDLFNTAPQLIGIVRDGMRRDIPYSLVGSLGVDLPLVNPVRFETGGTIRLTSNEVAVDE